MRLNPDDRKHFWGHLAGVFIVNTVLSALFAGFLHAPECG